MPRPTITTDPLAASAALQAGELVAFPTETVYGLGADAESDAAVARIFAVKGRPTDHPLIVHGADADVLERYGRAVPPLARLLADAFWPGPLTLIVPRGQRVADAVVAGHPGVGVRVPAHPLTRAMLAAVGRGVAAPSANRFGRTSPTTARHVRDDLGGDVAMILDGGACPVGVESTIVDVCGPEPVLLRSGGVSREALREVLGEEPRRGDDGPARAPGMLAAHYAPRARVEIAEPADLASRVHHWREAGARVCVLGHGPTDAATPWLEPADGVEGYARDLYRLLRQADADGYDVVVAVPPADEGVGRAVRDRLTRAAATSRD